MVLVVIVVAAIWLGVVAAATMVLVVFIVTAVGLAVVAAAAEEHGALVVEGGVDGHFD